MSVRQSNSRYVRNRRLGVLVLVAAVFMTNLDLWIVNVALPDIGASFGGGGSGGGEAGLAQLSWVLNGYAVALAAALIVAGRLGDRIGHRPVFLVGVVLFTAASAACAVAPNLGLLVAARVVQALGAAAQLPTSLALLLATMPVERRAGAARGWAAVGGVAAVAGPVLGGLLVEASWRWIFVVNLPIGLISLMLGRRLLPRRSAIDQAAARRQPMPDLVGAITVTVAVAALTGSLVQAPQWGWTSASTLGLMLVAVVTGAGFLVRCARHHNPLFELGLLRIARFRQANLATFSFSIAFAIMLLSNVLWCQDVWGYSALRTGLAMSPGPALVPLVTIVTGRAMKRFGPGPLAVLGALLFAASLLWRVLAIDVAPNYLHDLLPSMLLGGLGVGLTLGTPIAAGVTSLPADRSATGSAVLNAGRQIASAVGVALLVTSIGVRIGPASVADFRRSWGLGVALALVTAGLALRMAFSAKRDSTQETTALQFALVDEDDGTHAAQRISELSVVVATPDK